MKIYHCFFFIIGLYFLIYSNFFYFYKSYNLGAALESIEHVLGVISSLTGYAIVVVVPIIDVLQHGVWMVFCLVQILNWYEVIDSRLIQKHCLELIIIYKSVAIDVMEIKYFIHFFIIYDFTEIFHCNLYIGFGQTIWIVNIKMLEKHPQLVVCHRVAERYCGCQKLGLVDLAVSFVIDFVNYALNLVIWNFNRTHFNGLHELSGI